MSSEAANEPANPEEGDYIVNWHLQYASTLLLQGDTNVQQIASMIKNELSKIKTDFDFVKKHHGGPHNNLMRLRATDRELRSLLDSLSEVSDKMRKLSAASARRII